MGRRRMAADDRLRDELLELRARDRDIRAQVRGALVEGTNPYGIDMSASRNADRLAAIIDEHGWPPAVLVGRQGVEAAWLVALHADHDPAFQRRCLDLMADAAAAGEPEPSWLAYLTDRVLVNEGRPQRFGTQYRTTATGLQPHPIEDPDQVDQRRAEMGLAPLADERASLAAELES